jgi:predicted ATPase
MSIVKSIRIQNFKSLEDVTIDLSQLTLLFGANSSGKSSFLKALMFLKKNLYPINFGKTDYILENNIDLGSFEEIVIGNDKEKQITFTFKFEGEYDFPGQDVLYADRYHDNDNLKNMLKLLNRKSFFTLFKSIIKYTDLVSDNYIDYRSFIGSHKLDSTLTITFEYNETGSNLKNIFLFDTNLITGLEMNKEWTGFKRFFFPPGSTQLLFHEKISHKNNSPTDMNSLFEGIYPNILKYGDYLYNREIYFNDTNLEDVLSNEFNRHDYSHFNSKSGALISDKWKSLSDEEKLNEYYNYLNFLYISFYSIPHILRSFFSLKHLPTTREVPKSKYLLKDGKFEEKQYYGFLNVLETSEKLVNEYLRVIGEDSSLQIVKKGGVGSLILKSKTNSVNLNNASSGMIQILPLLIACSLMNEKHISMHFNPETYPTFASLSHDYFLTTFNTLLIEQPELHLHPRLQSMLSIVLKDRLKNMSDDNCMIIETHSEHLIRKLQVLIAKGELAREKVGVWYFKKDKNGVTKVEKMEIDENGLFKNDWPDGFFDDSIDLTMELFEALRKRKN